MAMAAMNLQFRDSHITGVRRSFWNCTLIDSYFAGLSAYKKIAGPPSFRIGVSIVPCFHVPFSTYRLRGWGETRGGSKRPQKQDTKVRIDYCNSFPFFKFQSDFYRHLHLRVCHQSHGTRLHPPSVYLSQRCVELAGFYSHNLSVSLS